MAPLNTPLGWKYRLIIDTTFFAFLLSTITNYLLSIFLSIIAFLGFLLTCSRLVESLYSAFVLAKSTKPYIVLFRLCCIALHNYPKSVFFISFTVRYYSFCTHKFHLLSNTEKVFVHPNEK